MKSRFQVNDESSEEEAPKKPEAPAQAPAPAPAKKVVKSRFQESEEEEEDKPAAPKEAPKEAPKAKPKSRFAAGSESESEDAKPSEPAPKKDEAKAPAEAKKPSRFAQDDESDKPSGDETPTADPKTAPAPGAAGEDEEEAGEGQSPETPAGKAAAAKKKRDKKKAKKAEEGEAGEGDTKKAKGKAASKNADLKKKVEERRKEAELLKAKCRAVFADIAMDLRRELLNEIKDCAADYRKKADAKKEKEKLRAQGLLLTRKQQEQRDKAEKARKAFEESQRQIAAQLGQGEAKPEVSESTPGGNTIDDSQRGKGRRRPRGFRKGSLNEKLEEAQKADAEAKAEEQEANVPVAEAPKEETKAPEPAVQESDNWEDMVADTPAPAKEADFDDWEQMVDDVAPKKAEPKPAAKPQPAPAKVAPPAQPAPSSKTSKTTETAAKQSTPKEAPAEKQEAPTPSSNPLEAFIPKSHFRCPIICIMGHVDTGKTKLLDHIRRTNVQANEAGGITQQIGASFFPEEKLKEEIAKVDKKLLPTPVEIPGLLIIDTPGHESFANLRSRGSSLCDFAIVVIDIVHGVENQTVESIKMLQEKGTPFVIALNKIDRIYQWVPSNDQSSYVNYNKQSSFVRSLFDEKYNLIVAEMAKLDINIAIYWRQEDPYEYVPVVPTSAITGEGVPDLLGYISHFTQTFLTSQITRNDKDFKATVLEVKKAEGVGSTVDLIIVNGTLAIDEKIVMSGFNGPIDTFVKGLLTPHPMKEMRVKNEYLHHQKVYGSMGVRLVAQGLESAIAGSSIFKYDSQEQLDAYSVELQADIKRVKKIIKLSNEGVGVAASSLGSLEALLVFLKASKIPVSTICIGDVSKNDLMKVLTPFMQEEGTTKKIEHLTMLCFDVKILSDAQKFADDNKIKIITARIIYHLFDEFTKHVAEINDRRKKEAAKRAMFPCILKQLMVINKKDPIILGVDVVEGILKVGTVLCIPAKDAFKVGVVESIEANKEPIQSARRKTGSVSIRIKPAGNILHGRQVELSDELVSLQTRESIDLLKEHFRDDMTTDDWNLVRKLKPVFGIK